MKTSTIALILLTLFVVINSQTCDVKDPDKIDCGFVGINKDQCESKGCCWVPVSGFKDIKSRLLGENLGNTPWCFYKSGVNPCGDLNFNGTNPGFTQDFYNTMYSNFDKNIDLYGMGGIVAAPDNSTPGGSYWYHWMRDAGLTMRHYVEVNDNDLTKIQKKMEDFIQWIITAQSESDPNNIDIRIEPKFFLNSRKPYDGGWCRPQTDGPALSATALMMYANILLDKGQSDYVKKYLWTSGDYNGGAIRFDLEWVNTNWGSDGCDLWEEIRSKDFFWNRMAFRYALQMASDFAKRMGEQATSQKYAQTAKDIAATLDGHWTGSYFAESTNRQKDASVIHALASFPGVYSPTDPKVAQTIQKYNILFCIQNPVNVDDNKKGIPGILYGRYEGDSYAGGNPWQLLSAVLGELFYKGATSMLESNQEMNKQLPSEFVSAWKTVLHLNDNATVADYIKASKNAGDAVLYRIYQHVKDDGGRIDEQINKNTGTQASAKGLTWSYANILGAIHYRNKKLVPQMENKGL